MHRSSNRILTTHGGSLVRPPEVVEGMRLYEHGRPYNARILQTDVRRSVTDVVRKQAEAGIDVPSDGEQGKTSFYRYTFSRLSNLEQVDIEGDLRITKNTSLDRQRFPGFYAQYDPLSRSMWMPPSNEPLSTFGLPASRAGWVCTGEVRYTGAEVLKVELERFRDAIADKGFAEAFVPSGSPTVVEFGAKNAFYPTREAYVFAVAEAMREEYRAIVDAGFVLQVDAPEMPDMYDRMAGEGAPWADYLTYAEMSVEATNVALEGIPEDRVRYHICWGSWNGPHTNDVPLKDILQLVLKVKAQAYYVEAANPRHEHEWQVWAEAGLPDGKILMPGVVAHTTNVIEHPEVVAQRIQRYAGIVGRENVIAATDCGFSQGWNSPRVHSEVQWAKLATLAEGAALASKRLWA